MADTAKFALVLEDLFTPSASKARTSVDSLTSSLEKAKSDLSAYQGQLSLAQDLGDIAGFKKYSALVQDNKEKVFGLTQSLEGASTGLQAAGGSAVTMAASLGLVVGGALAAKSALSTLIDVTETLVVKALNVVNANQLITAQFEALGSQGVGSGKKVTAMLGELGAQLPNQFKGKLVEWTKQLEAMGVTDLSKIRTELISLASAQAIMGDEGAAAYHKIQERVKLAVEAHHGLKLAEKSLSGLYKAGVNVADVSKRMGMSTEKLAQGLKAGTIDAQKFGDALSASVREKGRGPLDVMMNSLESIKGKAAAIFTSLFKDIDTSPLTNALRGLVDLGKWGASGLKGGFTEAMNAVIRLIGDAIVEAEVFFLKLTVLGLQVYIALKPVIKAIGEIVSAYTALESIKIGGALEALAPAGSKALAEKAGVDTGGSILSGLTSVLGGQTVDLLKTLAVFGDAKAQEMARQQGVNLGKATLDGVKEGVQAHSPSVAAMKIGMNVAEGLGMGLEQSPIPDRAARTVSSNALAGLAQGAGGMFGGGGQAGNTNSISIGAVNVMAPDGVTDAQQVSVVGLSTALERYQLGAGR